MDADGAMDNHVCVAANACHRAVVAHSSLNCRASSTRQARCAPVHRAHRPYYDRILIFLDSENNRRVQGAASHSVRHALGTGHRRNDSKINRSSVIAVPCAAATAAATAACAMAGFHPSPVRAVFACV
jgi:hypothetical protein